MLFSLSLSLPLSQRTPVTVLLQSPVEDRRPHLPGKMKRRGGIKSVSRQVEGRPAALVIPPVPSTTQPQDGLSPWPEGAQGTASHLEIAPATTLARTYAVPAAGLGEASLPPLMGTDAWQP